jgi:aminoglycoside phosphotransferase (APT) family kinase protein
MSLDACLPEHLRGPTTTITRVSTGLSGAGVYRVDAQGQAFVLKVALENEPLDVWQLRAAIQQSAASAGVAPRVIHIDPARRAIVTELVADRSFPAFFAHPGSREAAIILLGRTLRRVHDLPVPRQAAPSDPRGFLRALSDDLASFAVPRFVREAVVRVLAEEPPRSDRAPVLSHNDVNPSNLVFDGERLLLLDWDTAAPNDPYFDLAAVAVFLRMDEPTCNALLTAYDGPPVTVLPERFAYSRRLVAALCGSLFLHLARGTGHRGGDVTVEAAPSLVDCYARMRTGELALATADGKWSFGLALIKEAS